MNCKNMKIIDETEVLEIPVWICILLGPTCNSLLKKKSIDHISKPRLSAAPVKGSDCSSCSLHLLWLLNRTFVHLVFCIRPRTATSCVAMSGRCRVYRHELTVCWISWIALVVCWRLCAFLRFQVGSVPTYVVAVTGPLIVSLHSVNVYFIVRNY